MAVWTTGYCTKHHGSFDCIVNSGGVAPSICPACKAKENQKKDDARQEEINAELAKLAKLPTEERIAKLEEALIKLTDMVGKVSSNTGYRRPPRY
ncbi:MAG: hypothetical protein ABH884_00220 [Candidatus Komeilibacteria bacterium]